MPPVEAWLKVYIGESFFEEDPNHSIYTCVDCHGGDPNSADFAVAHADVTRDPSGVETNNCAKCHGGVTEHQSESLHYSLRGYDTALAKRTIPEHYEALDTMQANHCQNCHTTCGECHISQPDSVGGGLLDNHIFQQTPPMGRTCTACHGSRVGNEYTGKNEGYPADVHIRTQRMSCIDCHSADEMHGVGMGELDSRYDGPEMPACQDCHPDTMGRGSDIMEHAIHRADLLSCQVCHSVAYNNCWSCHTEQTPEGTPYYVIDWSTMAFMIGQNPNPTEERPYKYVTLRHVPAAPNAFDEYGENLLPNFEESPTWVYTTPHNIQRVTPQNERCDHCHGNNDIFLTEDKIVPPAADEAFAEGEKPASLDPQLYIEANRPVIVEAAPDMPRGFNLEPEEEETPEPEDEDTQDLFE